MVSTGCLDPDENVTVTCTGGPCIEVTINSNSTYSLQINLDNPPNTETGTATVTASTITFCETAATDCDPLNYTLSGDTLTITFTEDDSPGCLFTMVFTKK